MFTLFEAVQFVLISGGLSMLVGLIGSLVVCEFSKTCFLTRHIFGNCTMLGICIMILSAIYIRNVGLVETSIKNREALSARYKSTLLEEEYPVFLETHEKSLEQMKTKWWSKLVKFSEEDRAKVHEAYCKINFKIWLKDKKAFDSKMTEEELLNEKSSYKAFCEYAEKFTHVELRTGEKMLVFSFNEMTKAEHCSCGRCMKKVTQVFRLIITEPMSLVKKESKSNE